MFRVWVLPLLALACAVPWAVIRWLEHAPARRAAMEALFAGYIGALFYVVFSVPNPVGSDGGRSVWASINLVPSRTVVGIIRDFPGLVVLQLLDNVVLFVPLGFLLPLLSQRCRRVAVTAVVGLSVSVGIELVQLAMLLALASRRTFDVDDVILNVTGACLGYALWLGASALARRLARRSRSSKGMAFRGPFVRLLPLALCAAAVVAETPSRPTDGAPPAGPPRAAARAMVELRGAWIDRSSLVSRDEIRTTMRTLAGARFNVALVNVWSRGYPLWRSRVFARETGVATDPEYGDRDVLREAVEEARDAGIHLMPWVEYGFVGGYTGHHPGKSGCGPVFDRHPEWMARTQGGETRFTARDGFFCWMTHTRPDVQAFLLSLMTELATDYKTAGVQFDRARYPSLECGYDDHTRELYRRQRGADLPADPKDPAFVRWRADNLNAFVRTLYRRLKQADPSGLVSNAPIVYPYGYVNFAQDYPGWMRDQAVDFMVPQIYRKDVASYERDLDEQIQAIGSGERIVPGIDVTNSNAEVLIEAIELTRRKGLPGVVIWYYRGLERAGAFEKLAATVFAQPATLPFGRR